MNTFFLTANNGKGAQGRDAFVQVALSSLRPEMLDLDKVTRWLLEKLHPDGPACPGCGDPVTSRFSLQSWHAMRRVKCMKCGNHSTAAGGTILASTPLDIRIIYLMAVLLGAGLERSKVAGLVGVKPKTVEMWESRFLSVGGPL